MLLDGRLILIREKIPARQTWESLPIWDSQCCRGRQEDYHEFEPSLGWGAELDPFSTSSHNPQKKEGWGSQPGMLDCRKADIQRLCNSEGVPSRLRPQDPKPGPASHYPQAFVGRPGGELTPKCGHASCQAVCLLSCVT